MLYDNCLCERDCVIHTVLVKTGIITDLDKYMVNRVHENYIHNERCCDAVIVDIFELRGVFFKPEYQNNLIVSMYSEYIEKHASLIDSIKSYVLCEQLHFDRYSKIYCTDTAEEQWYLMKSLIPIEENSIKEIMKDTYSNYQYNGSSYGTPWTQTCFWLKENKEEDADILRYRCLFWRLDCNRISLRYYLGYKTAYKEYKQKGIPENDKARVNKYLCSIEKFYKKSFSNNETVIIPKECNGRDKENVLITIYLKPIKKNDISKNDIMALAELKSFISAIHENFVNTINEKLPPDNSALHLLIEKCIEVP